MTGFSRRSRVEDVWKWLDERPSAPRPTEDVPLEQAAGRILAADVASEYDIPGFVRGMMDGYAVIAGDTFGASSFSPIPLRMLGCSLPGRDPQVSVAPGSTLAIMTGAPLPAGADAVLPAELAERRGETVLAIGEVSPGKHVGSVGEDVRRGTRVLAAGRRLRPQDLGLLASIGTARVSVVSRPRVALVATGSELLPPGSVPHGHRIVDANSPMLTALVARDGGILVSQCIVPDEPRELLGRMRAEADVVLVAGGTSVGAEDHAPALLASHGQLVFHGVAMRPSSPAGLGLLDQRLVFLLPGNPVSCLCAYDFFAGRAIRDLGGRTREWPYARQPARLLRKLVSVVGRVDYARVLRQDGGFEPLAIGGASLLSSTTRADGFVVVPEDSEGFPEGATVDVWLYDGAVP